MNILVICKTREKIVSVPKEILNMESNLKRYRVVNINGPKPNINYLQEEERNCKS
jgi:RNase P/RNase MRP subunit p29